MTNVGEVMGPRTPRPSARPWVSVVLPAPRPPVRTTRSPAARTCASRWPQRRVSSAVASVVSRDMSATAGAQLGDAALLRQVGHGASYTGPAGPALLIGPGTQATFDQGQELLADRVGVLQHDDVAGVVDDHVLGARDQAHDLLAVRGRSQQVLLAVEHQRLDAVELLQRLALVMAVEGHHELGHDLHPGAEDHVRRQPDDTQRHRGGEGVAVDEEVLDVPAGPEYRGDQRLPGRQLG